MKISYIELLGQKHPVCFSLAASAEMDEAFGGLGAMIERMRTGSLVKQAADINKTLEILLKAGRTYASACGMDLPDTLPCAPADLMNVEEATSAIFSTISGDTEREVEAVSKNAEAAPGL